MIEITCRSCKLPTLVQSRKQKLCYLCRSKALRQKRIKEREERKSPNGYNSESRRQAKKLRMCDTYPEKVKREIGILFASGVKNGIDCNSVIADRIIKRHGIQ